MKNKNNVTNRTTKELFNLLLEEQALRNIVGNKDHAYAYASGAFIAIIEHVRNYGGSIQDVINCQCVAIAAEIEKLRCELPDRESLQQLRRI